MPSNRVFISYSSFDRHAAEKLCKLLEGRGVDCWIAPRNVLAGAKYAESIVQAIEKSFAVVLLFSPHSNRSEQVLNEIERAASKKKPIITLKIGPASLSKELEYFISRRQWLDATTSPMEVCVKQLAAALAGTDESAFVSPLEPPPQKKFFFRRRFLVLGAAVIFLFLTLLAMHLIRENLSTQKPDAELLAAAYQAIDDKDWPAAETHFQRLIARKTGLSKSDGYAGLAALAYAQGYFAQAMGYAGQAETHNPEIGYSHVILGHILLEQGKIEEAAEEYRIATTHAVILPWQKAIAYNRLGRIEAAQGRPQEALKHYNQAIAQHGHLAVAYANKGYLLEKLGNTGEAIDLYRQALQIDPDDAIAGRLLQEAERRRQAAQEKERQDYIDKLVSELLQLQKEGEKAPVLEDTWTSAPLTLWIVDFKLQGIIFSREGEAEVLMLRLTDALENTKRVNVVDRKILEKLLTELKLGATALADPQTALHIGKILAARLISSCSFTRFDSQGQLTMRVIDTETTRIVASIAEIAPKAEDIGRVMDDLVDKLMAKLKIAYPIQGIIAKVTDQSVVLNIGRQQGVAPGMTLQVYSNEDPMALAQNVLEFPAKSVALIEVTEVEKALCQAAVIEQMQPLQVGQKAREVSKN